MTTNFGATQLRGNSVKIQTDGRIVVGGEYASQAVTPWIDDFAVFRLLCNGAFDTSFGSGGLVHNAPPPPLGSGDFAIAYGVAIQSDGSIVAAGLSLISNGSENFTLARYLVATKPTVTTGAVDAIFSTGATLHGNVIPNFGDTNVHFDFGLDTNYGTSTPIQDIGGGVASLPVSSVLSGLNYSTTYHYRAVGVNNQGTTLGADAMLTTSGYDFGPFQQQYFSIAQLADPSVVGLAADPNHNGITNLMAYAFELNPIASAVSQLPAPQITNGYFTITYTQLHNPIDITYSVEVSNDLAVWSSGPTYTTQLSLTPIDLLYDSVTVRDNVPATSGPRFIRLRVTH